MNDPVVVALRGDTIETVHQVSLAVVDAAGNVIATAGDPDHLTYWRSAAKPFQLMPLVEDGGVDRYHLTPRMLALACGSHNAEPIHRETAAEWLAATGTTEADLACGGHRSLWPVLADQMVHDDIVPGPLWSNCSGKHAALLAMARLHDWELAGYQCLAHPVQQRVAATIGSWSGVSEHQLVWGVDGCTAAAVALPVIAMARAYARLATSEASAPSTIRSAMMDHPFLVAGSERLDTAIMEAWRGRIVVKVGADGVYSGALPTLGLGFSLKIHDGDGASSSVAMLWLVDALTRRFGATDSWPLATLERWRSPVLRNTREEAVGRVVMRGTMRWA